VERTLALAWDLAWDVTRDLARDVARNVAGDVARDMAWDAAWLALRAVVVRAGARAPRAPSWRLRRPPPRLAQALQTFVKRNGGAARTEERPRQLPRYTLAERRALAAE
jgi:hypothetical protein